MDLANMFRLRLRGQMEMCVFSYIYAFTNMFHGFSCVLAVFSCVFACTVGTV